MMKNLNNRGETLAETIIALSVLAVGITIASTIMVNSVQNLTNAKSRVIGVNIAREGIEAVRSIRDSNWLFYSDRRRACWNHDPSAGPCDGNGAIPPGTYVVYKHDDGSWRLILADENPLLDSDGDTILDNDLDRVALGLVDIDLTLDSDGLDPDNSGDGLDDDLDMYNHTHASLGSALGDEVRTTTYTRYITIEYLENAPNTGTNPSNLTPPDESINTVTEWTASTQSELNRMRITSTVEWLNKGFAHSADLTTIISDHLGRNDLVN